MKKQKLDFKNKSESSRDRWYDLYDDWDLVEVSFAKQYGIRLRCNLDMRWGEFCVLLSGLMHDTPLGQIISIRNEKDMNVIKQFNESQRKIHREWADRNVNNYDMKQYEDDMLALSASLSKMFG